MFQGHEPGEEPPELVIRSFNSPQRYIIAKVMKVRTVKTENLKEKMLM
jgi:hypothetical protein